MQTVAVLFARSDSIYKTLPGVDVFDADRNALTWTGGAPVVAHPPCRLWGRLRGMSTAPAAERDLAPWAVSQVRRWGGVLEHPAASALWPVANLPEPGVRDEFGGWTLPILQSWFGHRAEKATRLYICGVEPGSLPEIPFVLGEASHVIAQMRTRRDGTRMRKGDAGWRPEVTKTEREATPPEFAAWLLETARRCRPCAVAA